jgi:hypothetical protein
MQAVPDTIEDNNFDDHNIHSWDDAPLRRPPPPEHAVPSLAAAFAKASCDVARESGYTHFEALLTSGGDDRTIIQKETGRNLYHIRPRPVGKTEIFRGSCTGNPPTARGYRAAQRLYEESLAGLEGNMLNDAVRDTFQNQRNRLAKLLHLPEGAEIALCPSGSDAEYLPIAIARTLCPDAKIVNGVTQVKEVGAGTSIASVGQFFCGTAPLRGGIGHRQHLSGFEGIEGTVACAREADGSVVPAADRMDRFVQEAFERGEYPISHGVFGGKTGLRDVVMPSSLEGGAKSLGVVDACQGRFTSAELHEWLAQDSLVLFTGSKFYQAPPFCGAVIIPRAIADKMRSAEGIDTHRDMFTSNGLGAFLTEKELPSCLGGWKSFLYQEDACNVGLALRWEAGLASIEKLAPVSDEERDRMVSEWAGAVVTMVEREELLEAWWLERSIVSIRVTNGASGSWLKMDELRRLFQWMSVDLSAAVSDAKITPDEKAALSKIVYSKYGGVTVVVKEGGCWRGGCGPYPGTGRTLVRARVTIPIFSLVFI